MPVNSTDRTRGLNPGRRAALQAAVRTEIRLTPADVLALVSEPLAEVDQEFRRHLGSDVRVIADIGRHIAESGGKRIRPGLLLLASRACGYQGRLDIHYGAVFEFIHTATLLHDDVIDEAEVRRGRRSVNAQWGNTLTILLGDYLYSRSLAMALAGENLRVLHLMSEATLKLIEGEVLQTHARGRLDLTEAEYMDIIGRKTARLFAACSEAAALLAGNDAWIAPLRDYGQALGMAYQLVDDLLDLTGDEDVLGKPVASDLREGQLTLPVIDLLARRPELEPTVAHIMDAPEDSEAAYEALLDGLRREGCIERAAEMAHAEARAAVAAIAVLPPSVYRDALQALPDLLVARRR